MGFRVSSLRRRVLRPELARPNHTFRARRQVLRAVCDRTTDAAPFITASLNQGVGFDGCSWVADSKHGQSRSPQWCGTIFELRPQLLRHTDQKMNVLLRHQWPNFDEPDKQECVGRVADCELLAEQLLPDRPVPLSKQHKDFLPACVSGSGERPRGVDRNHVRRRKSTQRFPVFSEPVQLFYCCHHVFADHLYKRDFPHGPKAIAAAVDALPVCIYRAAVLGLFAGGSVHRRHEPWYSSCW